MFYLFTVRIERALEQYIIQSETYELAVETLKSNPKLKPFYESWGYRQWIVSCYYTKEEPKEI